MSDRETALQVSELLYGSDADIVRRANVFYHFLTGTDAATLGVTFGGLMDLETQQPVAGIPEMVGGRLQVKVGQAFVFSAVATDKDGAIVSAFTAAVDDPDVADIQTNFNGAPQNFFVTLTSEGPSVVTLSDGNFTIAFSMDVAAE